MSDGGNREQMDPAALAAEITVLAGNPNHAELAAVTAVLAAALEEAQSSTEATAEPTRSAWQRGQRPVRMPLSRGAGTWRSFSG